ncbi:maleylpyruvate isomerase family mycothiol-dependent enzyme [Agrococcus sp. ProA11]|uniref:maleylpyruvate isomerase family mycothiol-dependent enzyme n=1 Tax=Agrococcus chionoecetis TaxID=3153752 RepID=UPI0032608D61
MDHLRALATHQAQFLQTTRSVDPATPIPWLGEWTIEQLVVHLARIYHWADGKARRQASASLGRGPFDLPRLYADTASGVLATLSELDPDAPAWALIDDGVPAEAQTGTVRFWHRRLANETLVHLWDLHTAVGEAVEAPAGAWLDCLDEVVTVMHPRQLRLERGSPPSARVVFRPTDVAASLAVSGAPDEAPRIVIAGPVRALALLAWGRGAPSDDPLGADGIDVVEGDPAHATSILRAGLTP